MDGSVSRGGKHRPASHRPPRRGPAGGLQLSARGTGNGRARGGPKPASPPVLSSDQPAAPLLVEIAALPSEGSAEPPTLLFVEPELRNCGISLKKENRTLAGPACSLSARRPTITFQRGTV